MILQDELDARTAQPIADRRHGRPPSGMSRAAWRRTRATRWRARPTQPGPPDGGGAAAQRRTAAGRAAGGTRLRPRRRATATATRTSGAAVIGSVAAVPALPGRHGGPRARRAGHRRPTAVPRRGRGLRRGQPQRRSRSSWVADIVARGHRARAHAPRRATTTPRSTSSSRAGTRPATLAPRLLEEQRHRARSGRSCSRPRSTSSRPSSPPGTSCCALDMTPAGGRRRARGEPHRRAHHGHPLPRGPAPGADDRQAPDASRARSSIPQEFYELVKSPPAELLDDFPWLKDPKIRPEGASLEGFLYPATYTVRVDQEQPDDAPGPRPDDAHGVPRSRRRRAARGARRPGS